LATVAGLAELFPDEFWPWYYSLANQPPWENVYGLSVLFCSLMAIAGAVFLYRATK